MHKTIKSSAEISAIFDNGKRYNTSGFTILVRPSLRSTAASTAQHDPSGRVAFIAGKKNGNAVWRNAAKRRMRALCQEFHGPWDGFDVIFLAKRNILKLPFAKLEQECGKILKSAFDHDFVNAAKNAVSTGKTVNHK